MSSSECEDVDDRPAKRARQDLSSRGGWNLQVVIQVVPYLLFSLYVGWSSLKPGFTVYKYICIVNARHALTHLFWKSLTRFDTAHYWWFLLPNTTWKALTRLVVPNWLFLSKGVSVSYRVMGHIGPHPGVSNRVILVFEKKKPFWLWLELGTGLRGERWSLNGKLATWYKMSHVPETISYILHLYTNTYIRTYMLIEEVMVTNSLLTFCISIPLHTVSLEPRSPKQEAVNLTMVTRLPYKLFLLVKSFRSMGKTECFFLIRVSWVSLF